MKPSNKQKILLSMATAAIAPLAYAKSPGYEQTITMTMSVYTSAPATYLKGDNGIPVLDDGNQKIPAYYTYWSNYNSNDDRTQSTDEEAYKIVTWKVGSKEILTELVEADVISSITGWSIKTITDERGDNVGLFLVKKDTQPIRIHDYLNLTMQANAVNYKSTAVTKYNTDGDVTSYKETDSGNSIGLMNAELNIDGESYKFNLHGIATDSYKYIQGESEDWNGAWVSNGGTYKLVGSLDFPPVTESSTMDDSGDSSRSGVVEGTWKISTSKYVDITDYWTL